jgi:hypothetical protein
MCGMTGAGNDGGVEWAVVDDKRLAQIAQVCLVFPSWTSLTLFPLDIIRATSRVDAPYQDLQRNALLFSPCI